MTCATYSKGIASLQEIAKQIGEANGAFVKVGVLSANSARTMASVHQKTKKVVNSKFSRGLSVQDGKGKITRVAAGHMTNAEIGAIHEFGSPGGRIPERSFLRMPILSRLDDELRKNTLAAWRSTFEQRGLLGILRAVGQAATNVVLDAFATNGFGRWAKLKPATIRRKRSTDILRDTVQLMRSISFAVVKGGAK